MKTYLMYKIVNFSMLVCKIKNPKCCSDVRKENIPGYIAVGDSCGQGYFFFNQAFENENDGPNGKDRLSMAVNNVFTSIRGVLHV